MLKNEYLLIGSGFVYVWFPINVIQSEKPYIKLENVINFSVWFMLFLLKILPPFFVW